MSLILIADDSFLPSLYNHLTPDSNGHLFHSIYQFPIIIGNVIQMLLTLIAVLAIIYITYAGIQYITSEGDPTKTAAAKTSITNAVIGIVLSSSAYILISFVAGRFS